MKIDILAMGVHPDDVELSCAGTLLVEKNQGNKIGIIDLTQGELGSRGSVETRKTEAAHATEILGLDARENLEMADGFFLNDQAHQLKIIRSIRKYQPEIILCNAPSDRHPDHGRSAKLVSDASFLSGLIKIETDENNQPQNAWRPKYVFHYIQDRYLTPHFVIDISEVFEQKMEAIRAFSTQFSNSEGDGPQTYISNPGFMESIIYRHKMFGKMIGVKYAEGFISDKMIGFSGFSAFIRQNT
jgi:bacillithiol biosynthesis deacetylase BshB1